MSYYVSVSTPNIPRPFHYGPYESRAEAQNYINDFCVTFAGKGLDEGVFLKQIESIIENAVDVEGTLIELMQRQVDVEITIWEYAPEN